MTNDELEALAFLPVLVEFVATDGEREMVCAFCSFVGEPFDHAAHSYEQGRRDGSVEALTKLRDVLNDYADIRLPSGRLAIDRAVAELLLLDAIVAARKGNSA